MFDAPRKRGNFTDARSRPRRRRAVRTHAGPTPSLLRLLFVQGCTAILVRDRAPSEDRNDLTRYATPLLVRVSVIAQYGAAMLPTIAEVEEVGEGLAGARTDQIPSHAFIDPRPGFTVFILLRVRHDDPPTIDETELVQMRSIPACEGAIDCGGEVGEGVGAAEEEIASRWIREFLSTLAQQDDAEDEVAKRLPRAGGGPLLPRRRPHRGFRPPFDHCQNSSRVISRS